MNRPGDSRSGRRTPDYHSSIPRTARKRIGENYSDGTTRLVEYVLKGQIVGRQSFFENGQLAMECAFRKGRRHGTMYRWHSSGGLCLAEPFVDGMPHGVAKQWSADGKLLGTYTMVQGTGIGLWRDQREDGSVYLAEAHFVKDGCIRGFEWFINEDQRTVYIERSFNESGVHGIWREWNERGRLSRGFPQYYVDNEKVTRRQYLRACKTDRTMPPFRDAENDPARVFPREIAKELRT